MKDTVAAITLNFTVWRVLLGLITHSHTSHSATKYFKASIALYGSDLILFQAPYVLLFSWGLYAADLPLSRILHLIFAVAVVSGVEMPAGVQSLMVVRIIQCHLQWCAW